MASVVLDAAATHLMQQLLTDTVKVVLVDTALYTFDADHEFLSDVPAGARVAISPALANKTVTDGVLKADDVTLPSVAGATVEAFYVYSDTGDAATSRLWRWCDDAAGLVYTPNSGDVTIYWQDRVVFGV